MTRRGTILFEMLVAIGIFVGAASLTLGAMRRGFVAMQNSDTEQLAVDVARSKLAELEAGVISITQLRSDFVETIGSIEVLESDRFVPLINDLSQWTYVVDTNRTEFPGLTLVELTVYTADDVDGERGVTLRQLMRIRPQDAEAYEEDELIEGLPDMSEDGR